MALKVSGLSTRSISLHDRPVLFTLSGYSRARVIGGKGAAITITGASVAENTAAGTAIGTLGVANVTGTPTFTLADSAGGLAALSGGVDIVRGATALSFQSTPSFDIIVGVSGVSPPIPNRTIRVAVINTAVATGTLAATGSADTAAIAAGQATAGTLAATEAPDTAAVAAATGQTATGALAATGTADTAAFAAGQATAGTLAATGAPDTAAIAAVGDVKPTLVWDGDTTDATPDFEVTIDRSAVVIGTVITLRRADDTGFTTNVVDITNTLDSGEIDVASFNFATGTLPNATYYFKVKESVNEVFSDVETVTIAASSWTTIADFQTATYTGVTPVCTRTGTAYATDNSGAYSSFGTDTLRRTNKGLLVEPAATNLLTYGLDPSDVDWGSWQVTSVTGGQTDPLGGTTAAEIVSSGGGGGRFGPAGEATYPAGTYTISGHFKRTSGSNDVRIETNSAYFSSGSHRSADFNLVTLATSVSGAGISNPQIEALANGWYRCSAQVVTEVSGSAPVTTFYSASAAGTFLGWHAQVEAGTKRTSPILVPGATQITRPADVVTLTVPSGKTQFRHTLSDGSVTTAESVTAGATYTYPTAQAPLYIRKTEAS